MSAASTIPRPAKNIVKSECTKAAKAIYSTVSVIVFILRLGNTFIQEPQQ